MLKKTRRQQTNPFIVVSLQAGHTKMSLAQNLNSI